MQRNEEGQGRPALAEHPQALVYTTSHMDQELRQGEIISNVAQHVFYPIEERVEEIRHGYVVILSQDCDLLRDYENINDDTQILNGILLYEAVPLEGAKATFPPGRDIYKQIKQNNHDRYHLLEGVFANDDLLGEGFPALVVDFRRYFTVSSKEIYRQCKIDGVGRAIRRCRLEIPYREHLQCRAAFYFQRVGLPGPHTLDA